MKNLTNFLEKNQTVLGLDFGEMTISTRFNGVNSKPTFDYLFTGVLLCQKQHFEGLLSLGVKVDFSDIRVGFQKNQNTCGGSGNTNAVRVSFNFETYKKIECFFRKEGSLSMLNNYYLNELEFPLKSKGNYTEESIISEASYLRLKKIRTLFHEKKLSERARVCNYVQKNL